jgi:hypothetical protein
VEERDRTVGLDGLLRSVCGGWRCVSWLYDLYVVGRGIVPRPRGRISMLGDLLKEYSQRFKMLIAGSILESNTPRVISAFNSTYHKYFP